MATLDVVHVLGSRLDPDLAEKLHGLSHHGTIRYLELETADTARRRLRATTADGLDVGIMLPREERLFDGAVLHMDEESALVVRVRGERWLVLMPSSVPEALELGYHAGNLHWRVRFDEGRLLVALEAPAADYLARLGHLAAHVPHHVEGPDERREVS
ncbi:urease accessory protein [Arboricoccus pini]|uniref:Urease accessory protein n=1 Tax=Arboricoccus pini TaxID=1963835 RepID=A0A212S389_9PROT|nr:urease accessory protein UreE [Arboricoccus pini]SNB79466.1 urease accessory protein [Arboricoccus pini]